MPDLSILLPSLRPASVRATIDAFARTNASVDYELIVVSPFSVDGHKVLHLAERERQGVIHAINEAFARASAEHVVVWSDDAIPEEACLARMLEFVRLHEVPFVGGFGLKDATGKRAEQWSVYGKPYAGWLCTSKKTLEAVGGLFRPEYRNYWADPDLSLRVWAAGGRIEFCPAAALRIAQISDDVKSQNLKVSFDSDTETFFNHWHSRYGQGRPRVWTDINTRIPNSLSGHLRARLRKIPLLRKALAKVRS